MSLSYINRRKMIQTSFAANILPAIPRALAGSRRVSLGAIRWDAWYSNHGKPVFAQNMLKPAKWRGRAPWFCQIDSANSLSCNGGQKAIDIELNLAKNAGLTFWAYTWYGSNAPESSQPLMNAWRLHQSSKYRDLIKWCAIVGLWTLGNVDKKNGSDWSENVNMWINHWSEANYQRTPDGRPILFIIWSETELNHFENRLDRFCDAISEIRKRAIARQVGDPYIVLMRGDISDSIRIAKPAGLALSNYLVPPGTATRMIPRKEAPFSDIMRGARIFWQLQSGTGLEMIPITCSGLDSRPTVETPWPGAAPSKYPDAYWVAPTPDELRQHLKDAISFVEAHPDQCRARCVLIYSWDECAEGGNTLLPSIADTSMIKNFTENPELTPALWAIKSALGQ